MKSEIAELNVDIKKQKDTYNYIFSECESDQEKDTIVKRFMSQIFGPKIFQ